jgi:hypothetical protein
MFADRNNPGLKHYREIREKAKVLAILKKEIHQNNPALSDKQTTEVAKAALLAKNNKPRTLKIGGNTVEVETIK